MLMLFGLGFAQQTDRPLSIEEAMQLAIEHHPQLKISADQVSIAQQQTEVVRLQQLPSVSASAKAFYQGDVLILDKNLSKLATVAMPHFGNSLSVQASELIFKGGLVQKSIQLASLSEQLATLDLQRDRQNIKLLIISNYLDLYKLNNQLEVYQNNKRLAQERLANVKKFYAQGMVTRNEIIRGELQIKNLDQAILTLANDKQILNYQLVRALGLPDGEVIIPTETLATPDQPETKDYFLQLAHSTNPQLKAAETQIAMAEKNVEIIKTDLLPAISAFTGYSAQRPVTTSTPALDVYSNTWQGGVSVNYNIDNLYKSKENIKLGELRRQQAADAYTLTLQNVDTAVNAAYLKYNEMIARLQIAGEAKTLADENYKIIEAKFLNQLAIQAEMTDASNQKLEAALQEVNAEISVLFQYYNLMKTVGTL